MLLKDMKGNAIIYLVQNGGCYCLPIILAIILKLTFIILNYLLDLLLGKNQGSFLKVVLINHLRTHLLGVLLVLSVE